MPPRVRRTVWAPTLVLVLAMVAGGGLPIAQAGGKSSAAAKSFPADTTHYQRQLGKFDRRPNHRAALIAPAAAFVRDPIVSNTNANLTNTDTANDGEPSIAVNPSNPNEIIVAAFSGGAGFYRSTDGGNLWTFTNTYSQPPGGGGIPNDQEGDFTRNNLATFTFLDGNTNIYTGTTANAGNQASWNWPLDGMGNAIRVNTQGINNSDQPWLVTAPQPGNLTQDNIYSAYDDFSGGPDMQVAVSAASDPPNFTNDVQVGTTSLCCSSNPGLRLARDSRTGFVYAMWQDTTGSNGDNSTNANIHLNRSTDGGQTWTLNGNGGGIVVASGASNQRTPKFGTVNALIGGVHHAAVDPVTGDVFVVYACGDGVGGDNPLCLVRVHDDGSATGTVVADPPLTITTLHSALPSIAVASNRVIGVLFTTFDGFSSDGFPIFSAHLSLSDDQGATWSDRILETSLSSATDNGNNRQRVLGDYQELTSVGRTFYGVFTANGAPFGRPVSNMDPIFFKASAGGPTIAVSGDLNFGTVARGTSATRDVTVQNVGTDPLVVNGVSFAAGSDPSFSVVNPSGSLTVSPGGSVVYTIKFAPPGGSGPGTRTGSLRIDSSDTDNPTVTLAATGDVGVPNIALSGDLNFGTVARGTSATRDVTVQNTGQAPLTVSSVSIAGDPEFSVLSNPSTPQTIAAGSSLVWTVKFAPPSNAAGGTRTATLSVQSDDPDTPTATLPATGTVGVPAFSLSTTALSFGGVPVDNRTSPNSADLVLVIANQASCQGCDLQVTSLAFSGPNASSFSLVGAPALPAQIGAGNHLDLTVRFNPATSGIHTGTLTIGTDDPAIPSAAVALDGLALLPAIGATPDSITFGPTVYDTYCADRCGTSQNVTFTNTGQAELIVDAITFTGSAAFSGPAATGQRVATSGSFVEAVNFRPFGSSARKVEADLKVSDLFPLDGPLSVDRTVHLCGESVGRGIRVLAVDQLGVPFGTVGRVTLQSFGTKKNVKFDDRNVTLTTIDPPTSCQRIQYQWENQDLPSAMNQGQKSAYYVLKVTVGNKTTTTTFNLDVNEFKIMTVVVQA